MDPLFKKADIFTDIHFGEHHNSEQHNQDCIDFIKWMIEQKTDSESFIFLGDWHHSRSHINVSTLNYTLQALELLSKRYKQGWILVGNHDAYYRDRIDTHSIKFANLHDNIKVIEEITRPHPDVVMAPWLGKNVTDLSGLKGKFLFGHLELPGFKLNNHLLMPDKGETNGVTDGFELVFTGHFHFRQQKNNVVYIGNTFPISYSDSNDLDRGFATLTWDKEYQFHNWNNAPYYLNMNLSELMDDFNILKPNGYVKLLVDVNLNHENSRNLRDSLVEQFNLREMTLATHTENIEATESLPLTDLSVDDMIIHSLNEMDSVQYNKELLIALYKNLEQ